MNHRNNSGGDKDFDVAWRLRYEDLGRKDVPDHEKATYPSQEHFSLRDLFLHHLTGDLLKGDVPFAGKRMTCLDVGCNAGLYTKMLRDQNMDVVGIDYSESLLRQAANDYQDISFQKANAYHLPFKDNSFDAVVSFGLIQCVADWGSVLLEMWRVLRPAGIAIVETNRPFPLAEKMVRHASWLLRGKMNLRSAIDDLKKDSRSSLPSCAFRKYSIEEITRFLIERSVHRITIHDPARLWLFHNFFWGINFTKLPAGIVSSGRGKVRHCPLCLRSERWRVDELRCRLPRP